MGKIHKHVLVSVVALLTCFASTSHAQTVPVGDDNILRFSELKADSRYVCYDAGSRRLLGRIKSGSITIGAKWSAINIKKEVSSLQLRSTKSKVAKLQLRALNKAIAECSKFRFLAPTPTPTQTQEERTNQEIVPPIPSESANLEPVVTPAPLPTVQEQVVAPPIPTLAPLATPTLAPQVTPSETPSICCAPPPVAPEPTTVGPSFEGSVYDLPSGAKARAVVSNENFYFSTAVEDGHFTIEGLQSGTYFLKVVADGLDCGPAKRLTVDPQISHRYNIRFNAFTKLTDNFAFHWEDDGSRAGHEYSAYVIAPPSIQFLNEQVHQVDSNAASKLRDEFKIVLSDENQPWDEEAADSIYQTLKRVPMWYPQFIPTKWTLSADHITDDIRIENVSGAALVTISIEAFVNANPRQVLLDGERGRFFSRRLHHALVSWYTDGGTDWGKTEHILRTRYGVTTVVPDYRALTAPTTGEDANSFQQFYPREKLMLISMFEEMPEGMRATPGLKYIVRRKDGMPHPRYSEAAAVAWPTAHVESFIEFMESAFNSTDEYHSHRLILHEKSHFLWARSFSQEIKQDWIDIGGWYPDPERPTLWLSTKSTEFVTAYGHQGGPDEDMAESVSFYVMNPDLLRSRAPEKFEFIKNRIMHGYRYVSQIRSDLQFEVFNLMPDYVYPGKIKRLDTRVTGRADEDKTVSVEIELYRLASDNEKASSAYMRITSPDGKSYFDLWLFPVGGSTSSILRGSMRLSKMAQNGFWGTRQIVVQDPVGNSRYEDSDDFGWRLYINNPNEDRSPPKYVPGSLTVSSEKTMIDGRELDLVTARWSVDEDRNMSPFAPVFASLSNPVSTQYSMGSYGTFDELSRIATVQFYVTPYRTSGLYGIPYLSMQDEGLNLGRQYFSASPSHQPLVSTYIQTADPDTTVAELDVNRISVSAFPTNPQAPDGETRVKLQMYARDDKSGVGTISFRLRDPQGLTHFYYWGHENVTTVFFRGEPTEWKLYETEVLLPRGSAPGIWGVEEIAISDKAGNLKGWHFYEIMHFQLLKEQ